MVSKQGEALRQLYLSSIEQIPEYDQKLVKDSKQRCADIFLVLKQGSKAKNNLTQASDPETVYSEFLRKVKISVLYEEYARLKRFLILYFDHRFSRICTQFWRFSGDIKKDQYVNLAEHEKKSLLAYRELINTYNLSVGMNVNQDMLPPNNLYEEVLVSKDSDQVMDENGEVYKLSKGSVHLMPRKLAESLLLQGIVTLNR